MAFFVVRFWRGSRAPKAESGLIYLLHSCALNVISTLHNILNSMSLYIVIIYHVSVSPVFK